jgi:hypothetical protein
LRGASWSIGTRPTLHGGPPRESARELRIIRRECLKLRQHLIARRAACFSDQRRLADALPPWIGTPLDLQPCNYVARGALIDRDDHDAPTRRVVPVHREAGLHGDEHALKARIMEGNPIVKCGLLTAHERH